MRITVPALIILAIVVYRLSTAHQGGTGKEPAIVSMLLLAALVYKFFADGHEREKQKQADAQNRSEDGYSVEAWTRIRRRGLPSGSPASRTSEPPTAENEPIPITRQTAGPVRPQGPSWGQLARRLISATVIMFCYLVLALSVSGVFLPYYRLQSGYEMTQATVMENAVDHQVVHGIDWYCPCIRLRYQVSGVTNEQWCGLDNSHFYQTAAHPAWGGLQWFTDRPRAEKKLFYPVGSVVRAWYLSGRPEQVVVPDTAVISGTVVLTSMVGAVLVVFFTVPAVRLLRKAWTQRFVLHHTTGRVLRGEVRCNPANAARVCYSAVLFVQRTGESAPQAIEWGKYPEPSAATAELGRLLAARPIEQTTRIWFDPAGRCSPTFESFGFLKALVELAALIMWAPTTLVILPFQVGTRIVRR